MEQRSALERGGEFYKGQRELGDRFIRVVGKFRDSREGKVKVGAVEGKLFLLWNAGRGGVYFVEGF